MAIGDNSGGNPQTNYSHGLELSWSRPQPKRDLHFEPQGLEARRLGPYGERGVDVQHVAD